MNIYAPKINFYTLFAQYMALIDISLFKRFENYDVNQYVEKNKITYIDYLEQPLYSKEPLYKGKFKLEQEILDNYVLVGLGLYQRKDTLISAK